MVPAACRAAMLPRVSAATSPGARLREPFLFNMGQVSMFPRCYCCVFWEEPRRCFAHCLPLDHPKAGFLVDFDSGQRSPQRACHPFIDSDLPHRSREGWNFSLTECQKSPRDAFPQEISHLNGPNFLGVNVLQVIRDAVLWGVSSDFLRFRQRANPLVVVELLRGLFLSSETSAACLSRKRHSSGNSPVNGIQVFLPLARRTKSTHWRQFDVGQRSDTCFASTLLPLQAIRAASAYSALVK